MAITKTDLTSGSSSTDLTSHVTTSITPSANKLVVLAFEYTNSAVAPANVSASGNGLTWVQIEENGLSSSSRRLILYRAMGASPSAGAVTITTNTSNFTSGAWSIKEFGGVDTGGTNGSGAVVQAVKASGTGVTTLSVTLAAFGSVNNATYGAFHLIVNSSITAGSGFTSIHDLGTGTPTSRLMTEWRSDNDTSVDATFASTTVGGIALELKAGSGSGSLSGATIASTASLNAPTLRQSLSGATIAAASQVFAPALHFTGTLAISFIGSIAQTFSPSVATALSVRTSTQDGDFGNTATWGGLSPPTGQAIIAHAVVVTDTRTIGLSRCSSANGKPTVAATGSGGSLPSGSYSVKLAAEGVGGETTPTAQSSTAPISTGQVVRVTVPALLGGSTGYVVYLSEAGGQTTGPWRRYATNVQAGSFDCTSASWENGTLAFASAPLPVDSTAVKVTAGSLSIESTLNCRGDLWQGNAPVTVRTGSGHLLFDTSAAPAGTGYDRRGGTAASQTSTKFSVIGDSAVAPARVTSTSGSTWDSVQWSLTNGARCNDALELTFADLDQWLDIRTPTNGNGTYPLVINHCVARGGNAIDLQALTSDKGFRIQDLWLEDCTGAGLTLHTSNGPDVGVDRYVRGLSCDVATKPSLPGNGTIVEDFFLRSDGWANTTGESGSGGNRQMRRGLVCISASAGPVASGDLEDVWEIFMGQSNPHGIAMGNGTQMFRRCVAWDFGAGANGDCFKNPSGGDYTFERCMLLPNANFDRLGTTRNNSGTLWSSGPPQSGTVRFFHCTAFTGSQSMIAVCEGGDNPDTVVEESTGNLVYGEGGTYGHSGVTSSGPYHIHNVSNVLAAPPDSGAVASAFHHNGGINLLTDAVSGNGYNKPFSGTPGTSDVFLSSVTMAALFVDWTRNPLTWGRLIRGHSTGDADVDMAATLDDLQADPYLVTEMQDWIWAGFRPVLESMRGAAEDGDDLGAVEMTPLLEIAHIGSSSTLSAPRLSFRISSSTIGSGAVLFSPTVAREGQLLLPLIQQTATLFAPTLSTAGETPASPPPERILVVTRTSRTLLA